MSDRPTFMDAVVQFLTARLDEDERAARACSGNGQWEARDIAVYGDGLSAEVCAHIARHDPARVMCEVNAKRLTLERFVSLSGEDWEPGPSRRIRLQELRDAVRCLALPYANHPDYRDEWRP